MGKNVELVPDCLARLWFLRLPEYSQSAYSVPAAPDVVPATGTCRYNCTSFSDGETKGQGGLAGLEGVFIALHICCSFSSPTVSVTSQLSFSSISPPPSLPPPVLSLASTSLPSVPFVQSSSVTAAVGTTLQVITCTPKCFL